MSKITFLTIFLVGILVVVLPKAAIGQNCDCGDLCCDQFGFCGSNETYCGEGCQAGPCFGTPPANVAVVGDILTEDFFNGITSQAGGNCAGNGFYSRAIFLQALNWFTQFGMVGSDDDSRHEIAAFFAHVTHETGQEIDGPSKDYCDEENTQYPCNPDKGYYGRGPLQLSWNYNYGPAGNSIGFDELQSPEDVATDPLVSFKSALWFWMNNCHPLISQGFGATIRAINGLECDGGNSAAVQARVGYYQDYCAQFGASPGDNLTC